MKKLLLFIAGISILVLAGCYNGNQSHGNEIMGDSLPADPPLGYAKNFAEKIEAMIIDNREKNKEFSNLIMQEIRKMHIQFEYEINHHTEFRKIVQEELKEFRHDLHNIESRMASIERK